MIVNCEKLIRSSGLEMVWIVRLTALSFIFQILIFLFATIAKFLLKDANFGITPTFLDSLKITFYIVFYCAFIYTIIKNKGVAHILKSLFSFFFFLTIINSLIIFSGVFITPKKYRDLESFILIELSSENKKYKPTVLEKIYQKLFNKNSS